MTSHSPGQIGPYTITREIGRGGMGVVHLARDTKLDRDVAIKCLPEELAQDEERLQRFEREAKLLASLNHSNIATVHGLEEVEGKRYLVLEYYVEGETPEERLRTRQPSSSPSTIMPTIRAERSGSARWTPDPRARSRTTARVAPRVRTPRPAPVPRGSASARSSSSAMHAICRGVNTNSRPARSSSLHRAASRATRRPWSARSQRGRG